MPGPGTHIFVSDKVLERLQGMNNWMFTESRGNANTPTPTVLAAIAAMNPNYYALGAVGPDFFFFLPDFRGNLMSPLIGVVHYLDNLYSNLDAWILTYWEKYFGPGSENVDEAISRMTGDLSTVVGDISGQMSSLLSSALIDLATQSHDWFGLFSLGLNKGYDNKDFFWSDMLHYRKTSLFAHNLWSIADERAMVPDDNDAALWSDRLKAYALGYMTHVATDTTGHAFVNEKCGGPFRTHWQRHHLIENHMDAKTYDDEHGSDLNYKMFTESALHYRLAFGDDGGKSKRTLPSYDPMDHTIRGRYIWRRHLDLDSDMPEELATLLFDAMDRTYQTSDQASKTDLLRMTPDIIRGGDGRPSISTIQETYHTLFRYLKMSTLDGFSHEMPSSPILFPNLDFPQLTDPQDDPPGEGDKSMSFFDLVLAILRFILWLGAIGLWLATILPSLFMDLGTYLPRLLAYYTVEQPLFLMLKAFRAVLVMTGYFHPMQDEIDMGLVQIGNNNHGNFMQLLSDVDDILGTGLNVGLMTAEPVPDDQFPHQTKFETKGFLNTTLPNKSSEEYHHPWDYPETPLELCHTFAGPWQNGDLPHKLLENNTLVDEKLIGQYSSAKNPFETDMISFNFKGIAKPNMGDPVNFSSFLIWQLARPEIKQDVPDWNLDSDRGYGYKCWDWNRQTNAKYKDMENHWYLAPCTPPPQTDENPTYDPLLPLKIHYLDNDDPGCDVTNQCAEKIVKKKNQKGRSPLTNLNNGPRGRGHKQ